MLTPVLMKMATEIRNTADTPMTVDISTDSRLLMSYSSRDSRSQPRMRAAIAASRTTNLYRMAVMIGGSSRIASAATPT